MTPNSWTPMAMAPVMDVMSARDAENDADGDGRCADEDNCPDIGNDQTDTDGDGIGMRAMSVTAGSD